LQVCAQRLLASLIGLPFLLPRIRGFVERSQRLATASIGLTDLTGEVAMDIVA
jgi:hypothetical protein